MNNNLANKQMIKIAIKKIMKIILQLLDQQRELLNKLELLECNCTEYKKILIKSGNIRETIKPLWVEVDTLKAKII